MNDAGDEGENEADGEFVEVKSAEQRRILLWVLVLNVLLAAGLAVAAVTADSSGLLANALDNASDSAVYAISYFAVGRSARWKRLAATVSGVMLLVLAAGVLGDLVRRVFRGAEPIGLTIAVMGLVAAGVNAYCLWLLGRLRGADVNVRAARTFSVNDFVSNLGLLVAGGLVAWLGRPWPDLVVGLAVAAVAAKGGLDILRDARRTRRAAEPAGSAPPPATSG